MTGHTAKKGYDDAVLHQNHQSTLGNHVSMSQALHRTCGTPVRMTQHLDHFWRLPLHNTMPFNQIARFDLGHLAFLARGGLWEFHLSVLVTAAPGCVALPHPSYYTQHGSEAHKGLVKESAYVTRPFLETLSHTLALSLWSNEGVRRFLHAVRSANPWFYDYHHSMYTARLSHLTGLRIPPKYRA